MAAQVYCPLTQVPVGRVRTSTPSKPSWSTRVCAETVAAYRLPGDSSSGRRSAGTLSPSARAVIGPCARSGSSAAG